MSEEEAIDYQEMQLPPLSGQAFGAAFNQTLAAGESVLVSDGDMIIEVFPDGRRVPIKIIAPPIQYLPGTKIELY